MASHSSTTAVYYIPRYFEGQGRFKKANMSQTRPMGLPYLHIHWGGARGVNVGKYASPIGHVWVLQSFKIEVCPNWSTDLSVSHSCG